MLHKLCKKPIEITWCYLSPGPAEVNWSSVTDFSGIRTWHSALAMISLDKADQATGKKKENRRSHFYHSSKRADPLWLADI